MAGAAAGFGAAWLVSAPHPAEKPSDLVPGTYSLVPPASPLQGSALPPPEAQTIIGRATVVDGDTIKIRDKSIRLFGVDALESGQHCVADGKRQRCAQRAALALADKIGARNVACEKVDRDRYGRIVGVCHAGGVNLNAWLVAEGWALAYRRYSRLYVEAEQIARFARKGIWRTRFVKPWDARRGERLDGNPDAERACPIKGNIAADGERIYHVPGGYYYGKTQIDEASGERWFCSESEARAAGWRRASR